jgi:hypothetical protein
LINAEDLTGKMWLAIASTVSAAPSFLPSFFPSFPTIHPHPPPRLYSSNWFVGQVPVASIVDDYVSSAEAYAELGPAGEIAVVINN